MELIKIEINENNEQVVSGRELHEFLEVKTKYMDWITRMIDYGFVENVDFTVFLKNEKDDTAFGGIRKSTDHLLKIPMAKELSMIQRTDKGKQARKYFIKCEEAWNDEDMILVRALSIQNKRIIGYTERTELLEEKVKEQMPSVLFANAVATSHTSILIGELAKILKQNGVDTGEKRLFDWLRNKGYLISRKGSDWNMPTQKAMNMELLEIKESVHQQANGSIKVTKTPKVTGKGQQYFINKFLGAS